MGICETTMLESQRQIIMSLRGVGFGVKPAKVPGRLEISSSGATKRWVSRDLTPGSNWPMPMPAWPGFITPGATAPTGPAF